MRLHIVINNHIVEQVNGFNYLGYKSTVTNNGDLEIQMKRLTKCAAHYEER
jgi:hypothetical protein